MKRYYIFEGNRIIEIRYEYSSRFEMRYYILSYIDESRYVTADEFYHIPEGTYSVMVDRF